MLKIIGFVLTLCVFQITVQGQLFVDYPPPDYFNRTSLDDCVNRFHSDFPYTGIPSIRGGARVKPGEFSAFAAIGWTRSNSKIDYLCGGTLITLNFVLTAAHCANDGSGKQPDTVRLGDVDLSSSDDDVNAQQIPIKKMLRHPSYKFARAYHDIALIELEHDAKPGFFVCSACLWAKPDLNYDNLTVMGFGITDFAASQSPVLLKASLAPLEKTECQESFLNHRKLRDGIIESQFCASAPTRDACSGDSGGPILVELVDRTNKLIPFIAGVISLGTACADGSVGIYTRTASYIDWIESTTGASFSHTDCPRKTRCVRFYKETPSNFQTQPVHPWFQMELLHEGSGNTSFCGGALIDYRHVITSADCVSGSKKPTHVKHFADKVGVSDVIIHPKYESAKTENNLALLVLEKYLDYKNTQTSVLPVCPWKKPAIPKEEIFVSALGEPSYFDELYIINTTTVRNDLCEANIICTENKQDVIPEICEYNRGGPVTNYVRTVNEKYIPILYGVNSKGNGCGGSGNIFESTSISLHYNWIESVVLKNAQSMDMQQEWNHEEDSLNSSCTPATGGIGQCVPDQMCTKLIDEHRESSAKIKICYFDGRRAVICCPRSYL